MAKAKSTNTGDAGAAAQAYYEKTPSSDVGEFAHADARIADTNALTFTESPRSPYDGDTSRSQGKFRTTDSTKKS